VPEITVENVVACSQLGTELELLRLGSELPSARYSASGVPSVLVELDPLGDRKPAAMLFGNGKAVVTGVRGLGDARKAMSELKQKIKPIEDGIDGRAGVKMENLVARFNLGHEFDLAQVAAAIPGAEYDPMRFPGLILRMDAPRASYLLFRSGVVTLTDVRTEAQARKAATALEKFLREAELLPA